MATAIDTGLELERKRLPHRGNGAPPRKPARAAAGLPTWLQVQSVNVNRHAAALRPFRRDEFGRDPAAVSEAHLRAANSLISSLREKLLELTKRLARLERATARETAPARLTKLLEAKQSAHSQVQAIERVWDFYFELFGQRQSRFADWLAGCDRIALDCYRAAYTGLTVAKSIPAPPPLTYMETGFSPATFRRGIRLSKLGRQINPFPLIQLPYHRLVNPWTLGAVLHEVSHNLQNDLGLARLIPRTIVRRLLEAGLGRFVAATWARWNREIYADLSGLLLGGPAIVASLMDVVGRSRESALAFRPNKPHPTPFLRTLISVELLRRMGFAREAETFRRTWLRLYPSPERGNIPQVLLEAFPQANPIVVDTICFHPYQTLGGKSLAQVVRFSPKDQQLLAQAATRLATGTDPGVIPARFLVGAARYALERRLARPGAITTNFYKDLARR